MTMPFSSSRFPLPMLLCLFGLVLGGCASGTPEEAPEPPPRQTQLRDFSGHWEKDYQRSDDFGNRFSLYVADIRRMLARQGQGRGDVGGFAIGGGANVDAINGLSRFTEELTRTPLLVISQDEGRISIERENDFTLRCNYQDRQFVNTRNAFGAEVCGWRDEQLIISMDIVGGLKINHQFSLSADASRLNLTTTVSSDAVAVPLVISNFYQRFQPPEEDFNCLLTLSRNTVCSQREAAR